MVDKLENVDDKQNKEKMPVQKFKPVTILNDEKVIVNIRGVSYCRKEKMVEIVFQVENRSMVSIEVVVDEIFVNGIRPNEIIINGVDFDEDFDFCLGEFEAGKREFPYVVIDNKSWSEQYQNDEIEHIAIVIGLMTMVILLIVIQR